MSSDGTAVRHPIFARLCFYEHVRAERSGFARAQRAVDVVWPHLSGGCHTSGDTVGAIEHAGFGIESLRRFDLRPSPLVLPATPHVLGRAGAVSGRPHRPR